MLFWCPKKLFFVAPKGKLIALADALYPRFVHNFLGLPKNLAPHGVYLGHETALPNKATYRA
jgi:hypothetical protein